MPSKSNRVIDNNINNLISMMHYAFGELGLNLWCVSTSVFRISFYITNISYFTSQSHLFCVLFIIYFRISGGLTFPQQFKIIIYNFLPETFFHHIA